MHDRENANFLIGADPSEFSLEEAVDAIILLADTIEDLQFQLMDVPKSEFKGPDYDKWRMGAAYKRNKFAAAYRRFRARVIELRAACG